MIPVSDIQRDALTELINIGFGRAAASLSQLTGYRVILEVPHVAIHHVSELRDVLGRVVHGEVVSVHQCSAARSQATRFWCSTSRGPP